ncbi:hypothetical protein [Micromonospora sp. NPDC049679]|uniref:hypothetical protein n=1 Tax=Micromonospora sp. NPDC049679 TaxID=3155920 RepID=UPI0033FB519E
MTEQENHADAWLDYLGAAQQLDAVRRGAATVAGAQAHTVEAARDELLGVGARLAPQQSRLRTLGVPLSQLAPTPDEVAAAGQAMAGDPEAVLAALRHARVTADSADAAVVGSATLPPGDSAPWRRNLLVYGPFALVVLVVQIGLVVAAGGRAGFGALVCGLAMPVAAFGLGWLTVGLLFRPPAGGRVDRTALLGAAVCAAPLLVTAVGALAVPG